jgi:AcrR family transcriptional regulator
MNPSDSLDVADLSPRSRPERPARAPLADPSTDSSKARQILAGARKVFLRDGFDGASMNDIARVAGVSKGTIYVYFPSKEALFAALVREDKRLQAESLGAYDDHDGPVEQVLRRMGLGLMDVMLQQDHVAQARTVIAVAPKFPEIGRAFYDAGPQFGQDRFAAWLERKAAEGQVVVDDFPTAAAHFFNLVQGVLFRRMLFCAEPTPSREAIEATVDSAVRAFLAAYGKR